MEQMPSDTSTGHSGFSEEGFFGKIIYHLQEVGLTFVLGAPTVEGYLNIIGTTKNKLSMVQLIGSLDQIVRVEAMLSLPRDLPGVGSFQGKLMIVLAGLSLPNWQHGAMKLGVGINRLLKRSPIKLTTESGETITLELRKKQGVLVMRIEWPQTT